MQLSEIATVFAITLPLLTGSGAGLKYYADNEYVSGDSLIQSELRQLRRESRRLSRIKPEKRTDEENWMIEDLQDDIHDLQEQLND